MAVTRGKGLSLPVAVRRADPTPGSGEMGKRSGRRVGSAVRTEAQGALRSDTHAFPSQEKALNGLALMQAREERHTRKRPPDRPDRFLLGQLICVYCRGLTSPTCESKAYSSTPRCSPMPLRRMTTTATFQDTNARCHGGDRRVISALGGRLVISRGAVAEANLPQCQAWRVLLADDFPG